MITKQTIKSADWPKGLTITVVDDESELHAIEEPPEPIITVAWRGNWVVYGDDNADHPDFEEKWWPHVMYGSDEHKDEAVAYAKRWARAVRGSYEII
jgi:hypothetical protein